MRRLFVSLGWSGITVLVVAIGLMSGITSICREYLGFAFPGLIAERPLFMFSLRVSFFASAIWVSVAQARKTFAQQKELEGERKRRGRPQVILEYCPLADVYQVPDWERTDLCVVNTSDTDAYDVWFEPTQIGDFTIQPKNSVPRLPAHSDPTKVEYVVLSPDGSINLEFKGALRTLLARYARSGEAVSEVPFLLRYIDFGHERYETGQMLRSVPGINLDAPWFDLRLLQ